MELLMVGWEFREEGKKDIKVAWRVWDLIPYSVYQYDDEGYLFSKGKKVFSMKWLNGIWGGRIKCVLNSNCY